MLIYLLIWCFLSVYVINELKHVNRVKMCRMFITIIWFLPVIPFQAHWAGLFLPPFSPNLSHLSLIVPSPLLVYLRSPTSLVCQIGSTVKVVVVLFFTFLFLMLRTCLCELDCFALIQQILLFETLAYAFQPRVPPFSKSWIYWSSLLDCFHSSTFVCVCGNQGYSFVSLTLCIKREESHSFIFLLPYLNPLCHCVCSQNKCLFPQNVWMFYCAERLKKSLVLGCWNSWQAENNCYLLVVEWTKRSLSDIGKMNESGQQVALLTPDDLQRFNILISIFRTINVQSMTKINCFFLHNHMNWNHFQFFISSNHEKQTLQIVKLQIPTPSAMIIFSWVHVTKLPREIDVSTVTPKH